MADSASENNVENAARRIGAGAAGVSILCLSSLLQIATANGQLAATSPRITGYVQARETWQRPTRLTATLNRVRVSVEGSVGGRFMYRVMPEFEAPSGARTPAAVSLRDAYIRWTPGPWSLWFGQFKTPFTREFITSITVLETADRSTVVDTLAPKRDVGIMADATIGTYGSVAIGVFNGEGQNATSNRDSTVLWVARVTAKPIAELTLGSNAAFYGDDSTRYGADASIEFRGITVRGEVVAQQTQTRDRDDIGEYVLAAVRVIPWLQLVARQEDFRRPGIGEARRIRALTGGCNVDLPGGRTRWITDFVSRHAGMPSVKTNSWISQIQVRF